MTQNPEGRLVTADVAYRDAVFLHRVLVPLGWRGACDHGSRRRRAWPSSRGHQRSRFAEWWGFCDAMIVVKGKRWPSEALQKPSLHWTAGHEFGLWRFGRAAAA